MKKFYGIFLVSFLLLSNLGEAQVVQQSGSIYSEMAATITAMPSDSGNHYALPTAGELTTWSIVLNNLLLGNYSFASTMAGSLNYQVVQFTDTFLVPNRTFYILRNNASNYWGTYVYYPNYTRPLVIQSPHPKRDANTGHQGAYVFRQTESMLYMLAGTHRCNSNIASGCSGSTTACSSTSQPYPISDMAHDVNSIFQKTIEVFLNTFSTTHFIQLHGFTKLSTDPYVILSNGTQVTPTPDYMNTFKSMLYNQDTVLTFKVAHLDLSWTRLRGFWNTQGRLINASSNPCNSNAINSQGRFFHVEQERIRLRNTVSGWTKIANALLNTFPATALPAELIGLHVRWQEDYARIEWTTTSERNSDYFEIERSLDGVDFEKLDRAKALGNTSSTAQYKFIDYDANFISASKLYYRLRQYDLDGRFVFSKVVTLKNKKSSRIYIYPNPVKGELTLMFWQRALEYEIYSIRGEQLMAGVIRNDQPTINVADILAGMYLLKINGTVLKFVKQ